MKCLKIAECRMFITSVKNNSSSLLTIKKGGARPPHYRLLADKINDRYKFLLHKSYSDYH